MDSNIKTFDDANRGYTRYSFTGVCGCTLYYSLPTVNFNNAGYWYLCTHAHTYETHGPGELPECVQCLTTLCSILRKKIKHGL
jgi:hypothetical protein